MGFFKQPPTTTAPPVQEPVVVEEKRGFFGFGRRRTVVHDTSRRNSLASPTSPTHRNKLVSPTSPTHVGTFSNNRLDEIHTAIPAAREKVRLAEEAEAIARAALIKAQAAVEEARRHVDLLEKEAREQARLAAVAAEEAQVKLNAVDGMKKQTNKMGRI